MDLSKLPKMSRTPPPTPSESQASADPLPRAGAPLQSSRAFGDVWISIGTGIFVLLWQPRFLQWLCSRLFHTHFDEFMLNGNIVAYQTLPEFWSDLGPTLFAIVLILDGLVILAHTRILTWTAFMLTLAITIFNLIWLVGSYSKYGLAALSFIAVIFGGWIAVRQWSTLRVCRNTPDPPGRR